MEKSMTQYKVMRWATVIFLISFIIRLGMHILNGPMAIITYMDELLYFHIARSIAEKGQFLVRDMPTNFQKILYSVLISPAFLLTKNQFAQLHIIGVINCTIMSSVVFPTMMLARKLTSHKAVMYSAGIIAVTLPDMVFSTTLMSEVLYMPVVIWLFFCTISAFMEQNRNKRLVLYAVCGFVNYLAYLTKEVSLAYLIAAALLLAIDGIFVDHKRIRNHILDMLVYASVFLLLYMVMKFTVLSGLGNIYDNMFKTSTLSTYVFFYLAYSFVVLSVAYIMAFYIIPVFLPLCGWDTLSEAKKKMYLYTVASLFIIIFTIAYTISIREDLGRLVPRLHLRYASPLVIPFLILGLDLLVNDCHRPLKHKFLLLFLIIVSVFCTAMVLLIPHDPGVGSFMDHFSLKSMLPGINLPWRNTIFGDFDQLSFNISWMLFKLIMTVLTISTVVLLFKRKMKVVFIMLICAVLSVNALDNALSYILVAYNKHMHIAKYKDGSDSLQQRGYVSQLAYQLFSPERMQNIDDFSKALVSVNDYIKTLDGTALFFAEDKYYRYADIYLSPHIIIADHMTLLQHFAINNGHLVVGQHTIGEAVVNPYVPRILSAIDYIIVMEGDNPFTNVETLYQYSPFIILRNLDPYTLRVDPVTLDAYRITTKDFSNFLYDAKKIFMPHPDTGDMTEVIVLGNTSDYSSVRTISLNLSTDTTYVVEFEYWSDMDGGTSFVGLMPDHLPSRFWLEPTLNVQKAMFEIRSSDPDMAAAYLRFVNYGGAGNLYITNVDFYVLQQ